MLAEIDLNAQELITSPEFRDTVYHLGGWFIAIIVLIGAFWLTSMMFKRLAKLTEMCSSSITQAAKAIEGLEKDRDNIMEGVKETARDAHEERCKMKEVMESVRDLMKEVALEMRTARIDRTAIIGHFDDKFKDMKDLIRENISELKKLNGSNKPKKKRKS